MTILRQDVPNEDQWNVHSLYPSLEDWKKSFKKISGKSKPPFFSEISAFKGLLGKSANKLKACLDCYFEKERELRKLYTYAHLRHDEDLTDNSFKEAYGQISGIYHVFAQETSWLEPEILSLSKTTIGSYCKNKALADYHFFIEKLMRLKPHTLSSEKEELLAMAEKALEAPKQAFSAINDCDFHFGEATDSEGKIYPLSHGSFALHIRSSDRNLRKSAYTNYYKNYLGYENTLAELLKGQVEKHVFNAKARKYQSSVEAALFPKNIDVKVYKSLIAAVRDNIAPLHDYLELRRKQLQLKELHFYDMYVPFVPSVEKKYNFTDAVKLVVDSVAPLGEEYQSTLKRGLTQDRWVDRFENKNKRSGAYSSGCYDSMPYILMNFKGIQRDVFILAHEAGHSMHSLLSRKNQLYHYSDYSIFVAEVASTFNEELLLHHMLSCCKDKKERAFLINEKLEDLRATLFRQTMFAEFELFIHDSCEARIPLTPKLLKDKYVELQRFYFGKNAIIDDEIAVEWARIPHFYYNFYVFQYATGISAAIALARKVIEGGVKERNAYLTFLRSGSSHYPLDILKKAGVDMSKKLPIVNAIELFALYTKELAKSLK